MNVAFSPEELALLERIFARSARAQHREDLFEIFTTVVADMAGHYRVTIPHERALATARETVDALERIAGLSAGLERDAEALCALLYSLDERTGAALRARIAECDPSPRLVVSEAEGWLYTRGDRLCELARLASAARARYPEQQQRGQIKSVQLRRAGESVQQLFKRFAIPYTITATGLAEESGAVQLFRFVTGLATGRVEHYLP